MPYKSRKERHRRKLRWSDTGCERGRHRQTHRESGRETDIDRPTKRDR
jgi:hypothetical protein